MLHPDNCAGVLQSVPCPLLYACQRSPAYSTIARSVATGKLPNRKVGQLPSGRVLCQDSKFGPTPLTMRTQAPKQHKRNTSRPRQVSPRPRVLRFFIHAHALPFTFQTGSRRFHQVSHWLRAGFIKFRAPFRQVSHWFVQVSAQLHPVSHWFVQVSSSFDTGFAPFRAPCFARHLKPNQVSGLWRFRYTQPYR